MKRLIAVCCIVLLAGCDQVAPKKSADGKRTGAGDAIDTVVIQGGKIEAGQRAAKQIKQISADREDDLKGALGE